MISGWRIAGATLLILSLVPATPATAARGIPELEQALARQPPVSTPFLEYRFSRLLKRPVIAEGTLEYREGGVMARVVRQPRAESAVIVGDEVRVRRDEGPERRISLARAPQLRALLNSFRALLDGRLSSLDADFTVSLSAHPHGWTLLLQPRLAALAKHLARIEVHGNLGTPRCIEVVERDGDTSLTFLDVVPADLIETVERSQIEGRCRAMPGTP